MTSAIASLASNRAGSGVAPWAQTPETVKAYNEARDALNARARGADWNDPEFHRQVAADITSVVDYGFVSESLFPTYLNVSTVGEFDRVTVRERRGLKVFYTSRGGYIEESQIRDELWELPRDTMGFHVSEHIDKLRANFADTIESLVTLGRARLEGEVHRRVLQLMQAAVPSTAANYVNATTGITQAQVNAAIATVKDKVRPDAQGMVPVTILGRAQVTDKISDFSFGFDPEAVSEIRLKGRLGTYRGASVVTLHNYRDEEDQAFVPANELWVFGGDVGKFALYGGLQVKQWDENTVDYRHYRARRDFGGLVHHPEQAVRLVDGTITP